MSNNLLNYYLNELNIKNMPTFLQKYLETPSLTRLKSIGYFCGMDYASKNIKKEDVLKINLPKVKERILKPLVNGKRI